MVLHVHSCLKISTPPVQTSVKGKEGPKYREIERFREKPFYNFRWVSGRRHANLYNKIGATVQHNTTLFSPFGRCRRLHFLLLSICAFLPQLPFDLSGLYRRLLFCTVTSSPGLFINFVGLYCRHCHLWYGVFTPVQVQSLFSPLADAHCTSTLYACNEKAVKVFHSVIASKMGMHLFT